MLLLHLFAFTSCVNFINCNIFKNPFSIRGMFLAEGEIVDSLKTVDLNSEKEEAIKSKIESYLSDHKRVLDEIGLPDLSDLGPDTFDDKLMTEVVGNGVHVFRLCRRVMSNLEDIVELMRELNNPDRYDTFLTQYHHLKSTSTIWCDKDDIQGLAVSLARIQSTYMIPAYDLAMGIMSHDRQGKKLTSARLLVEDCLFIAEDRLKGPVAIGQSVPEYALAIEWLEAAYKLSKEMSTGDKEREAKKSVRIRKKLLKVRRVHDENFGPRPTEKFFVRQIGQDLNMSSWDLRKEEDLITRSQNFSAKIDESDYLATDFNNLCRGLRLRRMGPNIRLGNQCVVWDRGNPYLKLMPLKVEILSETPLIHMYHDIVTEKELMLIKTRARTQFREGKMGSSPINDNVQLAHARTQSIAWLYEGQEGHHFLEKIFHRLTLATGLEVARTNPGGRKGPTHEEILFFAAEPLQVGIYGPGGLYLPHTDAYYPTDTFSDDVLGGGTAFPKVGTAAFPAAGSAVFWFGLKEDGSTDPLSLHGACPTIHGIKWVGNKWIREASQIFKHPCSVTKST